MANTFSLDVKCLKFIEQNVMTVLKCSCQNVAWLVQFRENTKNIFLIFENCIWKKHHKSTEFYFCSVFYFITSVLQLTELWTATDLSAEKKAKPQNFIRNRNNNLCYSFYFDFHFIWLNFMAYYHFSRELSWI